MTNQSDRKKMALAAVLVLQYFATSVVWCYPSRPLNERSPDLTWQAWLLVDDQNQSRQTNADGMLRRRITPKSVFIAPTFSPDSLPACADGYSSDQMGRCVKIIKLDQDAHYEFLIQKLKEKFSPVDYEDEEEEDSSTAGPYQVNIPLKIDNENYGDEESEEETDVAIIVSPTKPDFDFNHVTLDKTNGADDERQQEAFLKRLAATTNTANDNDETTTRKTFQTTKRLAETTVPVTVTSTDADTVTSMTLTEEFSTVSDQTQPTTLTEASTIATTDPTTELQHTTLPEITTEDADTDEPPNTVQHPKRTVASEPIIVEDEVETTTVSQDPEKTLLESRRQSSEAKQESTTTPQEGADEPTTTLRIEDNPSESEPITFSARATERYPVRFPDLPASVKDISHLRVSSHPVVFKDLPSNPVVFPSSGTGELAMDYSNGADGRTSLTSTPRTFNRRNRERGGLFRWTEAGDLQKPLVLRFSRKHAYVDPGKLGTPEYYRSIPSDDFAYFFKFKRKGATHR